MLNTFPAILLAGSPHSGKSVLSYLLTMHLRRVGIDHYLVRAAPDGEGDWYLHGDFKRVQPLRLEHKGKFTNEFVQHMLERVQNRVLPLLVDIGGAPRDEQWEILRACTHSVLLYRGEGDLKYWRPKLAELELLPVAELHSDLWGTDQLEKTHPILQGTLPGLHRENHPVGMVFGALLDRLAGICHYDRTFLEAEHFRQMALPILNERALAKMLKIEFRGDLPWWAGADLSALPPHVRAGEEQAIYGRGPVWLAAALAVHVLPAPCWIFDSNLGWMKVPEIVSEDNGYLNVQVNEIPALEAVWVDISLKGLLPDPEGSFRFPEFTPSKGVVLNGKLPRWLFAALARKFAAIVPWVGIRDPRQHGIVLVSSQVRQPQVGDILPVPA